MVVLDGDLRQVLTPGAVGLEVLRGAQREPAGGRGRQAAHAGHGHAGTGHAAILRLVEADHEHGVVHAARHREHAVAERIRAGGAVVHHHAHRAVVHLEGVGDLGGALRRILGAAEDRLDLRVRVLETGVGIGLVGRLDDHVLRILVPVLAELAAAHADDGDLVPDGVVVHRAPKLRPRVRNCKLDPHAASSDTPPHALRRRQGGAAHRRAAAPARTPHGSGGGRDQGHERPPRPGHRRADAAGPRRRRAERPRQPQLRPARHPDRPPGANHPRRQDRPIRAG